METSITLLEYIQSKGLQLIIPVSMDWHILKKIEVRLPPEPAVSKAEAAVDRAWDK